MIYFLFKRMLSLIFVLVGISILTFWLTHMIPADPARLMAGQQASAEQVEAINRKYRLDRPVLEQYIYYAKGVLVGDFGNSMTTRRPVAADLKAFFPATAELALASLAILVLLGIPAGLLAAVRERGWFDVLSYSGSLAAVSMPTFWLGLLLQLLFYRYLDWFPVGGRLSIMAIEPDTVTGFMTIDSLIAGDFETFRSALLHLILPSFTLAAGSMAIVFRMTRASARSALGTTYVRAARSRGLSESTILFRHVAPNAVLPAITVIGLQVGAIFSGSVIVEAIFSWPGLGLYMVNAIKYLDYQAIVGVTIVISAVFVICNLIVDILYISLNPQMRGKMI